MTSQPLLCSSLEKPPRPQGTAGDTRGLSNGCRAPSCANLVTCQDLFFILGCDVNSPASRPSQQLDALLVPGLLLSPCCVPQALPGHLLAISAMLDYSTFVPLGIWKLPSDWPTWLACWPPGVSRGTGVLQFLQVWAHLVPPSLLLWPGYKQSSGHILPASSASLLCQDFWLSPLAWAHQQ